MVMITISTCKCDHVISVPFVRPWWLPSVSYLACMIIGTCNGVTWDVIRTFSNGKCGALIMGSNMMM